MYDRCVALERVIAQEEVPGHGDRSGLRSCARQFVRASVPSALWRSERSAMLREVPHGSPNPRVLIVIVSSGWEKCVGVR